MARVLFSQTLASRAAVPPALGLLIALSGCGDDLLIPQPAVRYVAFGDSATRGPAERDYSGFLPELLGVSADAVANAGDGGETTAEGLERLRLLLDLQIYPNGEVLIYWEGGNDLIDFVRSIDPFLILTPGSDSFPFAGQLASELDGMQANITQAVQEAQQAGFQVLLVTYFPIPPGGVGCDALPLGILLPAQAANGNSYRDLLNERIREVAASTGARLVDLAGDPELQDADPSNYEDCTHLNASGNAIVAQRIAEAIQGLGP